MVVVDNTTVVAAVDFDEGLPILLLSFSISSAVRFIRSVRRGEADDNVVEDVVVFAWLLLFVVVVGGVVALLLLLVIVDNEEEEEAEETTTGLKYFNMGKEDSRTNDDFTKRVRVKGIVRSNV